VVVTIKTGVTLAELAKAHAKKHGEGIGGFGNTLDLTSRLPTGIFALDLCIGGGLPMGRIIVIYGRESSGKTTLALKAVAMHQTIFPDRVCTFLDMENSLDAKWATTLGVDVDKLYVLRPDFAEQTVDLMKDLLLADDCGVVVLDSLAALIGTREWNNSAEVMPVAGSSFVIGMLIRKSVVSMKVALENGRCPTLILVNQTRFKVGEMWGDPETPPGGNAPKFASALTLSTRGKPIVDKNVSTTVPAFQNTRVLVKKWKVPVLTNACEYNMAAVAHDGLAVGDIDDFDVVRKYCESVGSLERKGNKTVVFGQEYKLMADLREEYYADHVLRKKMRDSVMVKVLAGQLNVAGAEA
jgi:recombination protein RecA